MGIFQVPLGLHGCWLSYLLLGRVCRILYGLFLSKEFFVITPRPPPPPPPPPTPPPPPPPPVDNNFGKFLRKIFFDNVGTIRKNSGKFLSAPLIFSFRTPMQSMYCFFAQLLADNIKFCVGC
jgi:hypothetical protein